MYRNQVCQHTCSINCPGNMAYIVVVIHRTAGADAAGSWTISGPKNSQISNSN